MFVYDSTVTNVFIRGCICHIRHSVNRTRNVHTTDKMQAIELTYISLLADIGLDRGIPSIRGSAFESLSWCVNDAPKLEKQLLQYIENNTPFGVWPQWIVPLRDRFVERGDPLDLRALRQLLLFCYKAEHKHTDETEAKATEAWRDCNAAVRAWDECFITQPPALLASVTKHCTSALARTRWDSIVPFHGPGAVYDGNLNKGCWSRWYSTIESLFPYSDFFSVSRHLLDDDAQMEITDDIVARLIAVPKDSRGPRLICVHPTESVWIQQGLRIKMEKAISRSRCLRHTKTWPKGHVLFDDQTINASLALKASIDRSYATLDLKEASDRLSNRLVQALFGSHYRWFGCCRATFVEIQSRAKGSKNGDFPIKEEIHSYAPMGNATTFPVQALVFWSVCVAAMEARGFHQPADCYVFGDDIIVPNEMYDVCKDALTSFGLVVNQEKSFSKSFFRESCGTDAFKGIDVTPVRWKTTYDAHRLEDLQSLSSIAQRLRIQGYDQASKECYSLLSDRLRTYGKVLPLTNDPSHGGIAEYSENPYYVMRDAYWHNTLHMYVSPILRLTQGSNTLRHGWNHVLSSLTSLERTGRSCDPSTTPSRGSRLNRGWARVFI